jgi:hypothetical protein
VGFGDKMAESGRVMATDEKEVIALYGMIASGLVDMEGLVGCMEDVDTKLPRDELFEMAEASVLVIGTLVATYCLGLGLANEKV